MPVDMLGDTTAPSAPAAVPVAFARLLRRRGLAVGGSAIIDFAEALAVLGPQRPRSRDDDARQTIYWAGRATLLTRPEDIAEYDRAFDQFWRGAPATIVGSVAALPATLATDDSDFDDDDLDPGDDRPDRLVEQLRFSRREVLAHKDLGMCSAEERAEILAAIATLRFGGATRRTRRLMPSRRSTGAPRPAKNGPGCAANRR